MHALTERNGVAEMAYCGDTPWHTLGQKVVKGAPIEEWVTSAHMGWTIESSPVQFAYQVQLGTNARGMPCRSSKCVSKVPDKKVLYRSDTYAPLSVVGDGYKVVQPREILEFFRDLTEGAGFDIETAGTLFGGRRFWALASIGESCEIVPGDRVGGYLLLCTAADGTLATTGKFTSVRVVCNNTLSISLDGEGEFKVSHKSLFRPQEMKAKLGLVHESFSTFADNMRRLSDKTVSAARAERLTFDLLKPVTFETQTAEEKIKTIESVSDSRGFKSILALFEGGGRGADIEGVKDTAWGWLNGVTEYVDYEARARSVDNRLNSALFGAGSELKDKAYQLALTY